MNNTIVSIIMPVYNCESTVSESIASVLNQSYKYFELIIVNDGSTDHTGVICDDYASKDSRVKVIHQNNTGPSAARNTGLNNALGKYIMTEDEFKKAIEKYGI